MICDANPDDNIEFDKYDQRKDEDLHYDLNGNLILDPYNPANVEIKREDVIAILVNAGLPPFIHNFELYKRAFTHKSYVRRPEEINRQNGVILAPKPANCIELKQMSFERLEYVGDGVLELCTKIELYKRFPKEDQHFLTVTKIKLVKNEMLGKLAVKLGLHKWQLISKSAEPNLRMKISKLGCVFEAFLGAIFFDMEHIVIDDKAGWFKHVFTEGVGFQMARLFLQNVYKKHVDWVETIQTNTNYKNILQVKIQKRYRVTPHYSVLNETNKQLTDDYHAGVFLCLGEPFHDLIRKMPNPPQIGDFTSYSQIDEYFKNGRGTGIILLGTKWQKTKKHAEHEACKLALEILDNLPE